LVRRLLAAAALLLALVAPTHAAVGANNLNNQIQQAGEDLDNANAAVKKALSAYNTAKAALDKAQAELNAANRVASAANSTDRKATNELGIAQSRTDAAAKKLADTQSKLEGERRLVSQLIGQVYRSGPMSQLDALLGAQSPEDLTERLQILQTWTANKSATIDDLNIIKAKVSAQKLELQQFEAQLAIKKEAVHASALVAQDAAKKAKAAQATVDAAAAIASRALKVAESHRSEVKKRYDALRAEQARLKAQAQQGSHLGSGLIFTGELIWPISGGKLAQGVGPRIHPVYGYKSCHTGIDISGGTGTPIHAAASGIVVSVLSGGPYGLHTLLAHGSGLTTMYAHQSAAKVKAGQSVTAGQVIGLVGTSGWVTGPHLHFEVRIDGTAYDPLGWFGHSKKKVGC
jgi:murein DD-endopeptidase MepM/ murein hydrolase activator NlpD